ncbi:Isopenicillin N synthase [Penicillium capsulatum]|uniref:Isopenicillin N synthase n=1 Tax=Penicillium capsulatum TaxID=69766 RepID=A0A9W9HZF3_9EURO|nr:Isopenicillin N synthase [Penicillium capsulatum]KAJ6116340.1 Isopenicillin N synthase [Penicillium capsulatum]
MSPPFSTLPATATGSPTPFEVSIPKTQLDELETLIKLSKIAPPTYENTQADRRYGVTRDWLTAMREQWLTSYKWKSSEARVNNFPQWMIDIEDIRMHFVGLFSKRPDAIPILFVHGWPGSFLEFLPMLEKFQREYSPSTLPYHLIVPSLPGYMFSSGPPLDKNFTTDDNARILDQLMKAIGFQSGYVAQGGDIGSRIARTLAVEYESCKGLFRNQAPATGYTMIPTIAVNVCFMSRPEGFSDDSLTPSEKKGLARMQEFRMMGAGYMVEHGTRPSTIGHAISTSPMALLAWVGEKFLEWVDEPLPLDHILESITLYWLTETFPRSLYSYRQNFPPPPIAAANDRRNYIKKPFGFSAFPLELAPVPRSWVETTGNLVYWGEHQKGGHFAALEQPDELKADLVNFVEQVRSEITKTHPDYTDRDDMRCPTDKKLLSAAQPDALNHNTAGIYNSPKDDHLRHVQLLWSVLLRSSQFLSNILAPGDADEKERLETLAAAYDPEPYWSEYHSKLPATKQFELQAPPVKAEPSTQENEVVATAPGMLPRDKRGRNESIPDFLSRLPPSTTSSEIGPWIWVYGPDSDYAQDSDVASFVKEGTDHLHRYEDAAASHRAAHDKSSAKTTAPLTRKLNALRRELEADILAAARDNSVTTGKWMLFPAVRNVDSTWKTIAAAVVNGDLGGCAKVATGDGSGQSRLICVYTKDFGDKEDVKRVLKALVDEGLVDERGKPIYYKCDAYTHLDIKSKNDYGLKASRFSSRDEILAD